jgi:hypothetical protein
VALRVFHATSRQRGPGGPAKIPAFAVYSYS